MDVGGSSEVAKVLGVSLSRVTALRKRPDFPDPVAELALGAVWDLEAVRAWNASEHRTSGAGRPSAEQARRTLGERFVLEDGTIGAGGFANVHRALDRKTNSTVAIKVLRQVEDFDDEVIPRFQRELRILVGLSHANVVRVLAHGETDDGQVWYAMPLAQGSLADFVPDLKGKPARIVDVMRQLCRGLGYVHENGVYHRDLKPANVLRLSAGDGETDRWAVSDFGLAVMAERNSTPITDTYQGGMGTWFYAAPEQLENFRSADHRSDIYSLGKILQELVTGSRPTGYEAPPGVFHPVVAKAIAHNPEGRYPSVEAFLEALDRVTETKQSNEIWETKEEQAERLRDRLRGEPTEEELTAVLDWAQSLDWASQEDMSTLVQVIPWMSSSSLDYLWEIDSDAVRRVAERFCKHVSTSSFTFEYCDTLANFMHRLTIATESTALLGMIVAALAQLGEHHNRWHVRDVLITILQRVRKEEETVEVVEALRAISPDELQWSLIDSSLRTLPLDLRARLGEILAVIQSGEE